MRRYFTENWSETAKMFECRLAYTRSTAVNSIVGYILGVGDRHVHNILIDKETAELIHIDLGIAFEQGKLLPTPETVPFRLSRDMVDGMGVCGVEGVFRRCAESTLRVMRANAPVLLMLLEVFLFDPLFMWKLDANKAGHVQAEEEVPHSDPLSRRNRFGSTGSGGGAIEKRNSHARQALLKIRRKLDGVDGSGVALSVEGHVNHLIKVRLCVCVCVFLCVRVCVRVFAGGTCHISVSWFFFMPFLQEATSVDNLCRLFHGWHPWV
jgi:serine-protein kinase ATM